MIAPVNRISEQARACMNAAVQDMQDKGYEKADVDLGDPSAVVMVEGGGEVPQHILEEIKQITSHDAATRKKSIRQQLQDGDYIAVVELVDHEYLPDGQNQRRNCRDPGSLARDHRDAPSRPEVRRQLHNRGAVLAAPVLADASRDRVPRRQWDRVRSHRDPDRLRHREPGNR